MNWLVLILISVLVSALAAISQRFMLKKDTSNPVAYSVFFQICIALILLIFGIFINDIQFVNLLKLLPNLALLGVLYGLGNIGIFTALKHTEASKFSIIFSSRALFSALGFTIILGEQLGVAQIGGIILLALGIVVVNIGDFSWKVQKGDFYALLAGLCFGLANINDKILLGNLSLYTYLFLAFFIPPLLILLLKPKTFSKFNTVFNTETLKVMISSIVLYSVGAITFFSALKVAESPSKVTTVNLLSIILTVVFAILLLKERNRMPQKVLGTILSVIGLYLII